MSKFWFIILSQILAACIVFYTTDKIIKKRTKRQIIQSRWIFPLTRKGVILTMIFLFIIGLLIWQDIDDAKEKRETKKQNEIELLRSNSEASKVQDRRDSIAFTRLQESKNETIEALARYGLKYDTAQKRIETLMRDSSRIMIVKGTEPLIKFCANAPVSFTKTSDIDSVTIKVCNEGAVSRNVTMRFFFFYSDRSTSTSYQSLEYIFEYPGLVTPFSLGTPEWRNFTIAFKEMIEDKYLYVLVVGSYTNSDASKTFLIDDTILFDFKESKHRFPVDRGKRLKELLEKKGIKL